MTTSRSTHRQQSLQCCRYVSMNPGSSILASNGHEPTDGPRTWESGLVC